MSGMVELNMTRAEAMRLERGLAYKELAAKAGVSRPNLNMKLNGHGGMKRDTLQLIADALGYAGDPGDLLETVTLREVTP